MRFIDLFAGLGGFHIALRDLGHQCVFASEVDATLRELYMRNFDINAEGDIREVDVTRIPKHDILCAGFPCQPFSKAGQQDGLKDPKLGALYKEILKVINQHHPKYLILENVPNLERHNKGQTWRHIKSLLEHEGYTVLISKLSPHHFGIPQIRERVYIVASTENISNFKWPYPKEEHPTVGVENYLDRNPEGARKLSEYINKCLDVWQEFLNNISQGEKIPHPIWSMEFGATYPYEKTTPCRMSFDELKKYRGTHGQPLSSANDLQQLFNILPSHAHRNQDVFPQWKISYIRKNREFYAHHKSWLDDWIPKIHEFPSSFQKLEWNCRGEKNRCIRSYILQIRPSGVRVKRRTTIPSLVAMTSTQVPIIAWENRYVTPNECMRLQSMDGPNGLKLLPESNNKAYEALGNAINVKVAKLVAEALVGKEKSTPTSNYALERTVTVTIA